MDTENQPCPNCLSEILTVETLSWSLVEPRLKTSTPWVLKMGGNSKVRLGYDATTQRLYARLPATKETSLPEAAYAELECALLQDAEGLVLEVSTRNSIYFREFHRLAELITEEYERQDSDATKALNSAIEAWQELVSAKHLLTEEQQIGLFGELMLLEAMLRRDGPKAVSAWIGRAPTSAARHDFRLDHVDIEVKTTTTSTRRHFVHGLQQLVPVTGHELYVLSIRIEAGGAGGTTLYQLIERVRQLASGDAGSRVTFDKGLKSALYHDDDAKFYGRSRAMADQPRLVKVDAACPRITPDVLETGLHSLSVRIDQLVYEVNFEGLGVAQGTETYEAILPNITLATG